MSWNPLDWFGIPKPPKTDDHISGLPDEFDPMKQFEKIIKPIIEGILSPFQSIIDDIRGFFNQIWELILSIGGFAYIGLLLAFAVYSSVFIILL